MDLFLVAWVIVGLCHWTDYMVRYCYRPTALDFILGLPTFIFCQETTRIKPEAEEKPFIYDAHTFISR